MAIQAASFITLEDGTRALSSGAQVYAGQPLTLQSDGSLAPTASGQKVYGISKTDANQYRNLAFGEFGGFGSGHIDCVLQGILLIGQSVFDQIEVYSNTTTSNAPVTVNIYNGALTYAVGDPLYVDTNGLITNDGTQNHTSLLGFVASTPAQNGGFLEVRVNPGVSSVASQLE